MHSSYRGLAFLLSLGSLPVACTKADSDDDTGGDTTTPGTNPTTGEATDPTTSPTSSPTTTPDATTSSTGGTDTGGTDTGGTETGATTAPTTEPERDSEVPPPATDPTCIAYAAKLVECKPRYARYQERYAQQCELYKEYGFRADGQKCLDALEELYVCLSMADCAEPGTCAEESVAIGAEACPNSFGG